MRIWQEVSVKSLILRLPLGHVGLFSKRKFLEAVNKMTASQNVERRHKSSIIVHPSPTAAVTQWVKALAPQAEGWVF